MLGIVAHTQRAPQAHQLMADTKAAYMNIDGGNHQLGCNANHKKVWTWLAQHCKDEWAIVLEDDAVPVKHFVEQTQAALAQAPSPVVSLYFGKHHIPTLDIEVQKRQAVAKAQAADAHWITSRQLLHAVAIAIRTEHIADMLAHINTLPDFFPIDEAISHWTSNNHIDAAYTWPSLVDHADQPTLFRHHDKMDRPPGRVAHLVGTRDQWTDKSVTL